MRRRLCVTLTFGPVPPGPCDAGTARDALRSHYGTKCSPAKGTDRWRLDPTRPLEKTNPPLPVGRSGCSAKRSTERRRDVAHVPPDLCGRTQNTEYIEVEHELPARPVPRPSPSKKRSHPSIRVAVAVLRNELPNDPAMWLIRLLILCGRTQNTEYIEVENELPATASAEPMKLGSDQVFATRT